MEKYEYMKVNLSIILKEIINQYGLAKLEIDGYVHIKIKKGTYGLPQAVVWADMELTTHLVKCGYHPTPLTLGLWRHESRSICFSLTVDNFIIEYTKQENIHHLLDALKHDTLF